MNETDHNLDEVVIQEEGNKEKDGIRKFVN
ncbi:hypothetical protein ZOSMA_8G01600 [Zostera marina]|uniref:Uncharacterized protein n=1 Tax=Zostera marina TaxID=29655 RepID=A0A0K9NJR5_ZOSMR|nr:hypothetical protein ZOSMA_8G01600 [Zostera marina]